ncbi:MAG: 3'-5' exonuclease [Treponema sp.]|jgi:DNA polymerase III epsilon subunit-like protein|nr:3'-5' exonuclease [Treponema sp.]
MISLWCDTETTGLEPIDSGPFEIAFLVYHDAQLLEERIFHLNPLNDEVVIHQGAMDVNGATEELIRSYPPAREVVPEIAGFFKKHCPPEKLVLAGYNCPFDRGHLAGLLFREGFLMEDYFQERSIDVLDLVKRAKGIGIIDPKGDNKLTTMTKALGIPHEGAHGAMADIKAARWLYEAIYSKYKEKRT